jgi:ribosomal protein S18 acetylase RimI-like enzyme
VGTDRAFLLRSVVDPGGRSNGVGTALVTVALTHIDARHALVALPTETR